MIIGYCRPGFFGGASGLDAQIAELTGMGAEKVYQDDAEPPWRRPGLAGAIAHAKAGDVIVVGRPHHLALTSRGVMRVIKSLAAKNVGLRILNTPLDTSTTTGRMVLGSTPLWSLNVSPMQSLLAEFGVRMRRS